MKEMWRKIDFGPGNYSVSTLGNIRNENTGKYLKPQVNNSGYFLVHLHFGNKRRAFTIHRLVAIAFVEQIIGKPFVDHTDGNKFNNCSSNLRWVDGFENMQSAVRLGLLKNASIKAGSRMKEIGKIFGFANSQQFLRRAFVVSLKIGNEYKTFRSKREAAKFLGIDHKTLSARLEKGLYQSDSRESITLTI